MPKFAPPKAGKPNDDRKLWEQWDGETTKQFHAFRAFRDLAPIDRTVAESYRRHLNRPTAQTAQSWYYQMSTRNRWRERSIAFDAYLDRMSFEAETDERLKARKLRRAVLLTAIKSVGNAISKHDFDKSTTGDIARLIDIAARNLREEYSDQPDVRQQVTLVNGGTSEFVQLADRAPTLSNAEVVAEYRRLTGATSRALSNGSNGSGNGDGNTPGNGGQDADGGQDSDHDDADLDA